MGSLFSPKMPPLPPVAVPRCQSHNRCVRLCWRLPEPLFSWLLLLSLHLLQHGARAKISAVRSHFWSTNGTHDKRSTPRCRHRFRSNGLSCAAVAGENICINTDSARINTVALAKPQQAKARELEAAQAAWLLHRWPQCCVHQGRKPHRELHRFGR